VIITKDRQTTQDKTRHKGKSKLIHKRLNHMKEQN